jgi:hypothetical protein
MMRRKRMGSQPRGRSRRGSQMSRRGSQERMRRGRMMRAALWMEQMRRGMEGAMAVERRAMMSEWRQLSLSAQQ